MAVTAAHLCGSKYIRDASRVSGLIYVASMLIWLSGHAGGGVWRYAALDLFALAFFFRKWSQPDAQHRQFHFLMMLSYLASTAFYAFRAMIDLAPGEFFLMSPWWYEFISNVLFELELALFFVYALLFRRSRTDRRKFREDTRIWLAQAGRLRRKLFGGGADNS